METLKFQLNLAALTALTKITPKLCRMAPWTCTWAPLWGADAVVSKMGFVNLPYFINSYEQVDDLIYDGWVGQTIKKRIWKERI